MAKQKSSGWLDKYTAAVSDATTQAKPGPVFLGNPYAKEMAKRQTYLNPQGKAAAPAMKQAAEDRIAKEKTNAFTKKIAEGAQTLGASLELAAPFTGPFMPIVGGVGAGLGIGSGTYLAGKEALAGNYGSAALNAGFAGLDAAGFAALRNPAVKDFIQGADNISDYSQVVDMTGVASSLDDKIFKNSLGIDWAKWNKEIPLNKPLMQEYKAIEQTSKANGTWMKNADGSAFAGTPEQFVQQQSSNFKKAFPKGVTKFYRGAKEHIDDFVNRQRADWALFGSDDVDVAKEYLSYRNNIPENDKIFYNSNTPLGYHGDSGLYELAYPSQTKSVQGNASGRGWRLVDWDSKIAEGTRIPDFAQGHNEDLLFDLENGNHFGLDLSKGYDKTKNYLSTDVYANYVKNTNNPETVARINDVIDGGKKSSTVHIIDAERTPIKSLRYNNGMFDLSNPNIYKSLVPALGAGAVASQFVDQKKDGGWLDKYNDGGPVQSNYNNASVSMSDDFVGMGNDTTGRHYSPAWGGQFQSGGYLSPEQYNKKHPPIYVSNPKDSRIGFYSPAGNQYLYKKPVQPVAKKPQPTPQSVIDWIEGRGKDENAPTRLTTSEDFAMGGSLPGAVGHMYSKQASGTAQPGDADYNAPRTGDIPYEGPGGKKTVASAQNGKTIDTIKKANQSARDFNMQYVQSPNYLNLLWKQGYTPEEIQNRQQAVFDLDASKTSYKSTGYNEVNPDKYGVERLSYNVNGLGDWSSWEDVAAHEWGHVGVTDSGPRALKPAEQKLLTDSLNWKNVSKKPDDRAHDMAPQENRADLVELRKALQDRGIYDSFKGGEFKQEHLDKLYTKDPNYWNRSMRLYKDKDIIKLMNTIAANNPQQGMPVAQNGMEMSYYQNGLDFKPKTISKNGSAIKDDRGQWAHPGKVTEIGSNQITMQGVPYPVLGISDTGDTQMMYPNKEYEFIGDSVTEYPMMADGGILDSVLNVGKGAVNYLDNLVKTGINKLSAMDDPARVVVAPKKAKVVPAKDIMDQYFELSGKANDNFYSNIDASDLYNTYENDKNRVKLNTGRFTGANVPVSMIDDLAKSAKKNGIPLGQMLALVGRESTFGQEKGGVKRGGSQTNYTSGWNVYEDYQPYDAFRFLADKKVPGITVSKNSNGYFYNYKDADKDDSSRNVVRTYLNQHPELLEEYKAKLAKTPSLGNQTGFDLSAKFLKEKGIQGYNPGDPNYVKMFQKDYDTLKQDKALMTYLKKKGYKYEDGGQLTKLDQLTNFTNYNTKQPGGWLDKYQ